MVGAGGGGAPPGGLGGAGGLGAPAAAGGAGGRGAGGFGGAGGAGAPAASVPAPGLARKVIRTVSFLSGTVDVLVVGFAGGFGLLSSSLIFYA